MNCYTVSSPAANEDWLLSPQLAGSNSSGTPDTQGTIIDHLSAIITDVYWYLPQLPFALEQDAGFFRNQGNWTEGTQCVVGSKIQYWDNPSQSWFSSSTNCPLTAAGKHHVRTSYHIAADSNSTITYDWYELDGVRYTLGYSSLGCTTLTGCSAAPFPSNYYGLYLNEQYDGTSSTATYTFETAAATLYYQNSNPAPGATYYLSPSGSDSNSGTSTSAAWLTPNHTVNCGDNIIAAAGTYAAGSFNTGSWGTVNCPSGSNVAWVRCATFDACKISSTSGQGMWIDESYWGVAGFEVTTTTAAQPYAACFTVAPRYSAAVNIHHIIVADNVANGCQGSGVNLYNNGTAASADYIAFIGNIAYNAAQGNNACYSGIGVYQPIASDTAAGTHIYIAGNFSYGNFDPATCASTTPSTDGEGIIVDTPDYSQGGGTPYIQQIVVDNNLSVGNGSYGIQVYNNQVGSKHAPIYLRHNTSWGNEQDAHQTNKIGGGEITIVNAETTQSLYNLTQTSAANGFGGSQAIYAFAVSGVDGTSSATSNWLDGTGGNNTFSYNASGFSFASSNTIGTSPSFANPTVPAAPSCSGKASTVACMSAVISNFKPTASGASAYGYQQPSTSSVVDSLYPHWLCNVALPPGLVTPGCS